MIRKAVDPPGRRPARLAMPWHVDPLDHPWKPLPCGSGALPAPKKHDRASAATRGWHTRKSNRCPSSANDLPWTYAGGVCKSRTCFTLQGNKKGAFERRGW